MKRLITLVVAMSVVAVACAEVWTDPQTGLQWTYMPTSNGEATLGDGLTAAIPTDTAGELVIPSCISGLPVTCISNRAFADCSHLTAVTVPASVDYACSDSFTGCTSLRKVTVSQRFVNMQPDCCVRPLPPALYQVAFKSLPITDVIIADGVTSINGAFVGCSTLQRVTIPSSVKTIGRGSFAGCTGLGHGVVVVSGWAVRIDDEIFGDDVVFPEGTRGIEDYAYGSDFWDTAPMIRSVRMPTGLEFIGAGAFRCCSNISSVVFSPDVKEIGCEAFTGCQGLTSVDLSPGLQTVGDRTFWRCENLAAFTIPSSVSRIGNGAFGGTKLVYEHEEGLVVIDGCLVGINGDCPKTVDIPEGVRLIADGVFSWRDTLETVTIPKSLIQLGDSPFAGCAALKAIAVDEENPNYKSVDGLLLTKDGKTLLRAVNGDVTIPEGVTTINEDAFFGCEGPATVTVPASVTSIGTFFGGTDGYLFIFKGLPPLGIEYNLSLGIVRYDPAYAEEWEEVAEHIFGGVVLPFGVPLPDGGPYYESVDGLSWCFMVENGEACVGGDASRGDLAAISQETAGAITVPAVLGECPVTGIGDEAFAGCSNLTRVVIPNSVTNIGVLSWNFWNLGCDATGRLYYEDRTYGVEGEYPNYHWTAEASERLPNLAWEVAYSFSGAPYPRLVISSSNGCLTQEEIAYLNDLASKYRFQSYGRWCTSIMDRVSGAAFAGCDKITSVSLPFVASLAEIFPDAYDKITNVVITQCQRGYGMLSDMVQSIEGDSVGGLDGCRNLVKVVLPEDTKIIEAFAFQDCSSLKSIDLPSGVRIIDGFAFSGCSSLESAIVPDGALGIGDLAFADCSSLTDVVIPNSIQMLGTVEYETDGDIVYTNMDWCSFRGCDSIRCVTVPSRYALRDVFPDSYDKIQAVVLSDGSSTIGASVFKGCEALESVVIPASVTSIDSGAFAKLSKLMDVTFLGDAPDFGEDVFYGTPRRMTLTVPEDSLGWNDYEFWGVPPPWGMRSVVGGSDGEPGGGTGESDPGAAVPVSVVVVSNVVVHYVMNSVMSSMAAPVTEDVGIVNVMTEIKGGNVAIPDSWASNYPTFTQEFGTEFAAALTKPSGKTDAAGNPMLVWQDYVAGTDPTDEDDVFRASVTIVDGKPVVSYTPELTAAEKSRRVYRTYGKVRLGDDGWTLVPEGREVDYNFFKVTVEMK